MSLLQQLKDGEVAISMQPPIGVKRLKLLNKVLKYVFPLDGSKPTMWTLYFYASHIHYGDWSASNHWVLPSYPLQAFIDELKTIQNDR